MGTTLRDQLSEAFAEHVEEKQPEPQVQAEPQAEPVPAEPEPQESKPGRTAGRPRDEKGRLLPGKPQADSAAEPGKASPAPTPNAQTVQAAPAAEPQVQRPPRPSSWKKDYWEHWDKLDPKLASYIAQREQEAVKGVSTYKAEYDRLKPINEAIGELTPTLQQYGLEPSAWLKEVGQTHKTLVQGTPEQKLGMIVRLAQNYQIPLQSLFVQGQDGRLYFNPQVQQASQQFHRPQAQQPQLDVKSEVQRVLNEERLQQTLAAFEAEVPTKYPHYEAVKQTMAGLLQAELATDLEDAYDQALKHPRHAELYADIQKQEAAERAKREAAEKAKQVARARSQAVSPRGGAPSAPSGSQGPKGIRAALEDACDQHAGSGRV